MLRIQQYTTKARGLQNSLQLPLDDYVFHMIVKKGKCISRPNKDIYIEVLDCSVDPQTDLSHVFQMTVLESSILEELYPQFSSQGLLGTWQLQGSSGHIKLLKHATDLVDTAQVQAFLLDPISHNFVKDRYKAFYGL